MSWFRKREPNKPKTVSTDSEWSDHLIKELDDSIMELINQVKVNTKRSNDNKIRLQLLHSDLRSMRIGHDLNL